MPIYEYKCAECGSHLEKIQKTNDEPLKTCENCGGALVKQWSLSGIQFKGAGWYVTDYGDKKNGKGTDEKPADTKSTEKTEPASKQETKKSADSEKKETSKD